MSTTDVNSPNSFATMNTGVGEGVDAGLKYDALQKKLQMESLAGDIFEQLSSDLTVEAGDAMDVPNSVFLKLDAVETGARTVTIPLLMALTGAPTIGAGTPIGNEETQNLKYATFYYQEYSYAVASTAWGKLYNEMGMYGVFEKIQPQISTYMKELDGERKREALLQTHCSVLTTTPTVGGGAAIQTAEWNKNWFVANADISEQPVWDNTAASFTEAIGDALNAGGGADAASGVAANASLNYLLALEYYVVNYLRIDPIQIGGQDTYVTLLPATQVAILKRNDAGKLGEIYTSMVRKDEDVMEYTGAIGRVGKLLLVEDQRYPTLTVGGVDGSWTLTPQYLKPGNTDARAKAQYDTGALNWDIGFLMGKAAICEWKVKDLHFETEKQNYGYNKGTGVFGESGISIVQYDTDEGFGGTAGSDYRENFGSVVLAMTTPKITSA
jgi:hypothetical protein